LFLLVAIVALFDDGFFSLGLPLFVLSGLAIGGAAASIARRRAGYVIVTILTLNPVTWLVNYFYGAKRWNELGGAVGHAHSGRPSPWESREQASPVPVLGSQSAPPTSASDPSVHATADGSGSIAIPDADRSAVREHFELQSSGLNPGLLRLIAPQKVWALAVANASHKRVGTDGALQSIMSLWGECPYRDFVRSLATGRAPSELRTRIDSERAALAEPLNSGLGRYFAALDDMFGRCPGFWAGASTWDALTAFMSTASRIWPLQWVAEVAAAPLRPSHQRTSLSLMTLASLAYAYASLTDADQRSMMWPAGEAASKPGC
jgi:hypothetical protein